MNEIQTEKHMIEVLHGIASKFPKNNIWVFSYGSSIRNRNEQKMIDLIFVVKDPLAWHDENMLLNPKHYSFIFKNFKNGREYLQDCATGVYYKALIPIDQHYGIISMNKAFEDMASWKYLYIAGRLHKPIVTIQSINDARLSNIYERNLLNALKCSLLILPERFTFEKLFTTIAGLSYNGDFRMSFAEDVNKVKNIVDKQYEHFDKLYKPLLESSELQRHVHLHSDKTIEQDTLEETFFHHLVSLPHHLAYLLHKEFFKRARKMFDQEEAFYLMSRWPDLPIYINKCLRAIVFKSSVEQSFKGIFTTGIVKSFLYSMRKLRKGLQSHLISS